MTSALPELFAGVRQVMRLELATVTDVAGTPRNCTLAPATKSLP